MRQSSVGRGEPMLDSVGTEKRWLGVERKWWTLVAVGVGTFVTAMGGAAVNTVLPLIANTYGASLSTIEWVVMAYLLAVSSLLLTFGRLGDMLGHKRVYAVGFLVLIIGSALAGMAPTEWLLVASRAVQGVAGAMLMASSPAIITGAFPASQRGQALGMQGTMTYLGLTIGPSLGGFISDTVGWHWVFLINVPIGVVATGVALSVIPTDKPIGRRERFDPIGAGAMTVGLALLLFALSKGQEWGWNSPAIVVMLVAAVGLLSAFVWIEKTVRFPMVDLTLFGNRLFSAATSSALLNYMCAYAVVFLMPFYLVQGRGFSPSFAGLLLSAMSLMMAAVAPLSGVLSDRIGSRLPSTAGMVFTAAGLVTLSFLGPNVGEVDIIWRLMLTGLGLGVFASPNTSAILGSVPPQRRGVASGITAMARNTGMVLGVAIVGALFSSGLARWTPVSPDLAFYEAIRETYLAVAVIAVIGAAISLVRGPQQAMAIPPARGGQKPG